MTDIDEKYDALFPPEMEWNDITKEIDGMTDKEEVDKLRERHCNMMLAQISDDYLYYNKPYPFAKILEEIIHSALKIEKDCFFHSLAYMFMGKEKECKKYFFDDLCCRQKKDKEFLNNADLVDIEADIAYLYLLPFKNAFDDFWEFVRDKIKLVAAPYAVDIITLIDKFYRTSDNNAKIVILSDFLIKNSESVLAKELLAFTYLELSMWNNAIALLEQIEDKSVIFTVENIWWKLAWAYGKAKDCKNEEKYYLKLKDNNSCYEYLYNNLGYCYYKQRKYKEALSCFKYCIDNNIDGVYPANNYVRTLLAVKDFESARDFIKNTKYKISKAYIEKAENGLNTTDADVEYNIENIEEAIREPEKLVRNINKNEQFTNERILEDELTLRIEKGVPTFGKNLKIYKRHGVYGRQYIIPAGRLDLLCEDNDGNLYIIELKKDSGYGDAYSQTAMYLDWFEKNWEAKNCKFYGIICVNNPTKQLIDDVHNDDRMQIFEYQISYTER